MRPQDLAFRIRRALRRRGPVGLASALFSEAVKQVRLNESHVWYLLTLSDASSDVRPLEGGLILRRAEMRDLPLLDGMQSVSAVGAEHRLQDGNELWMVFGTQELLFCCTIYRARAPVVAAAGGWLGLPSDAVCLEDSETAQGGRGRGIAPAAWSSIAASLAGEGVSRMITKVGVENVASRRAVEKAGFKPVAVMRFVRRGPLGRTRIEVLDPSGAFLRELLDRA
jgi:RimJ/RimL family protein N-acetyltransferase